MAAGIVLLLLAASCKKWTDEPGQTDPRLSRPYCNDPEAVNYNFDFPGTADNSVCYFPADAFSGTYVFTDSVYGGSNNTLIKETPLVLRFSAQSRVKLTVDGFCPAGGVLRFTANRALRASGDTTIALGQPLCRLKDTLSGYVTRALGDSSRLQFFLNVVSDTGTTTHRGTAHRQ